MRYFIDDIIRASIITKSCFWNDKWIQLCSIAKVTKDDFSIGIRSSIEFKLILFQYSIFYWMANSISDEEFNIWNYFFWWMKKLYLLHTLKIYLLMASKAHFEQHNPPLYQQLQNYHNNQFYQWLMCPWYPHIYYWWQDCHIH